MSEQEQHNPSHIPPPPRTGGPLIDIFERGADRDGAPQTMNRRLFMQLLAFETEAGSKTSDFVEVLCEALASAQIPSVVYEDANHPRGLGLLSFGEDPRVFLERVRPLFEMDRLKDLRLRPDLTMVGRTYSSGYEDQLVKWLIEKPIHTVLEPEWPWAIWYPLRRSGEFARISAEDQASVLREHGVIGRAYAAKGLAHDVRLACHGLDANDNEFVIGLIGKELYPLSHIVQRMRKTKQTSTYIAQMGPFFVGRAVFRCSGSDYSLREAK